MGVPTAGEAFWMGVAISWMVYCYAFIYNNRDQ